MFDNLISAKPWQRRQFLKAGTGAAIAGVTVATAAFASLADRQARARKLLMIDALSGVSNINLRTGKDSKVDWRRSPDKGVYDRALTDLAASGLSDANVTLGYFHRTGNQADEC